MKSHYATQYADLYRNHWWWRAREEYVLAWIDRVLERRESYVILDVGCGDGLLFDRLCRYGEVWGIEANGGLVPSTSRWQHRIEIASFSPAYSTNRCYDLVLLLDVLEHLENDHGCLQRTYDLLRPGGIALLTVPALPGLWSRHDLANCHYRRYTQWSLRDVVAHTYFKCERLHYFFAWTVLPLCCRRFLYATTPSQSRDQQEYEVTPPPPFLNRLLHRVCQFEQRFSMSHGTPLGSSLFAVLRRPRS